MLFTLNYDCLNEIFKYLDLQDHLTLIEVCNDFKEFIANRFKFKNNGSFNNKKPKHFNQLINNSHGSIECISDVLKIISKSWLLKFNNIKSLKIRFPFGNQQENANFIKILVLSVFPKLEKLTIIGDFKFNVDHYFALARLQEIEIHSNILDRASIKILGCHNLKKMYLKNPLNEWTTTREITRCSSLEELQVSFDDYILLYLKYGFIKLKKLRKLILTNFATDAICIFFKDTLYSKKIDSISFNFALPENHVLNPIIFTDMTKLRYLSLANDNGNSLRQLSSNNLEQLDTLEELYYLNAILDENGQDHTTNLLRFVYWCENLKILDISGTPFDVKFLEHIIMVFQLEERPHNYPLLLRCYNTNIKEHLQLPPLPKNLSLCFEPSTYELPSSNSIEINFKADHNIDDQFECIRTILDDIEIPFAKEKVNDRENELHCIRMELNSINGATDLLTRQNELYKMQEDIRQAIEWTIDDIITESMDPLMFQGKCPYHHSFMLELGQHWH